MKTRTLKYGIFDVFQNLIVTPFKKEDDQWIWLPPHTEYKDKYDFHEEPLLFDTKEEAIEGMETIINYLISTGSERTELSFRVIPINIDTKVTYYIDRHEVM